MFFKVEGSKSVCCSISWVMCLCLCVCFALSLFEFGVMETFSHLSGARLLGHAAATCWKGRRGSLVRADPRNPRYSTLKGSNIP